MHSGGQRGHLDNHHRSEPRNKRVVSRTSKSSLSHLQRNPLFRLLFLQLKMNSGQGGRQQMSHGQISQCSKVFYSVGLS